MTPDRRRKLDETLLSLRLDEAGTTAEAALLAHLIGDVDTAMQLTSELVFLWTLDVRFLLTGRNGEHTPMVRWSKRNEVEAMFQRVYRKMRRAIAAVAGRDDATWRRFVALGLGQPWHRVVADVMASIEQG